MYSQVMYCLERVPALVKEKPELAEVAPFSTVLELLHGDRAAMKKLTLPDIEKVAIATLTGMSVETFRARRSSGSPTRRIRGGRSRTRS